MKDKERWGTENAYFEQISIPARQSFLWRKDDYPWRRNVWNFHPQFELHLIRESSGLCYIGDYIGPFEPGQLTLVGSGLPHNWITLPTDHGLIEGRDIVVQFDPEVFSGPSQGLIEMQRLDSLFDRAQFGIEFGSEAARQARFILEEMERKSGLSRLVQLILTLDILAQDPKSRTLATPRFQSKFRQGNSTELKRLETALTFLQENFLEEIRLADVAKLVGMSESSFSRFFKFQTGNTFSQHVTSLRIWMAKRLLRETDMPITEIGFEAGFSNIPNFNRTFLRKTDMRPSEYRRASRNF